MALERELQTYEKNLPDLCAYEGQFVLIRGDEIAGTFLTHPDALRAGYELYGLGKPFFIRQIEAVETPRIFSRRVTSCDS